MKTCNKCKKDKSLLEFSKDRKNTDKLQTTCKECDRIRKQSSRYGLTEKQWLDFESVKACEICGDTKYLTLDHDHLTNAIRGRICNACNIGLARFKDNPALLYAAIEYLNKPQSTSQVVPKW
jgi:hypothetical protein